MGGKHEAAGRRWKRQEIFAHSAAKLGMRTEWVDGKHETSVRRWERQEIFAHSELPGLGCGQSGWVGNMKLQGEGGKDRKSLHIFSCQAWVGN
jgi:hypothetical protein